MWQHVPLLLLLLISAPPSSSTTGNQRVQITQQLQQLQTNKGPALSFGTLFHPNPARTQLNTSQISPPTNLFARAESWSMHRTLQGRAESSRLPRGGRSKPRLWVIRKHRTLKTASRLGRGFTKERCAPFFECSQRSLPCRMPARHHREPRNLAACALGGNFWGVVWVWRICAMR